MSDHPEYIKTLFKGAVAWAKEDKRDWRWLEALLKEVCIEQGFRRSKEQQAKPEDVQGFERFWRAYPKRVAKDLCRTRWAGAKLDAHVDAILAHVEASKEGWAREQFMFCPHPSTYINQRRWEVEVEQRDEYGLEGAL